jgi:haloalkane dehalogenase
MPFDRGEFADLYPFESHYLELEQATRLHYLDEGARNAPVLLFVHGNPTWSFHWRRLVARFSATHRCLAVDHIGCGLSDKPPCDLHLDDHIANLRALVERLGVTRYSLVAQDWGGAIGLGVATQRPEQIDRIVLFNTAAFPPPYVPWQIAACRLPLVGRLAVQGGNLFARAALSMTMHRERLAADVRRAYVAPYDSWSHRRQIRAFVDDIPTRPAEPTWQRLEQIERDLPTLAERESVLVWGMRDWCFRPECLERFEAVWPRAKVHRLDDVGHWVVEDAADEVDQLLTQFLGTAAMTTDAAESAE